MSSRSGWGWLIAIVFLGVLVGVVGGGVMGGVAGFYVARNNMPVIPTAVPAQPVSNVPTAPPPATNLSVNVTSAVVDTVKKVEPAVVTVINQLDSQSAPFGRVSPQASGSGFIIDAAGHVVTNQHVVEGARQLQVIYHDGTKADAELVGADAVNDIAVLQVKGKAPTTIAFGDSNALQLGEMVIAIGSPLGSYRGSVTVGVVSGLNRRVRDVEGLIQTDAAINHGNSGGPLINLAGQVVGVNTLVVRDTSSGDVAEGLGFSIPSALVKDIVQQIIANGKVEYPFIGIRYSEVTPQNLSQLNLTSAEGIVVLEVTAGSPAARAGLHLNDVVLAIDNYKIDEEHTLRSILFKYRVGDEITLKVLREGQTLSIKLKLVARPAQS